MSGKARERAETELAGPVRAYLEAQGFTVRSEVRDCDITAVRDGDLAVVELKRSITMDLLIQAARRQRLTPSVYVAAPRPRDGGRSRRWKGILHLLRRLELGLIWVAYPEGGAPHVEVAFHPLPWTPRRNHGARRAVITEINGRSGDYNTGGSTRRPLLTAYREAALYAAYCLAERGPMAPRRLRALGAGPKTQAILANNVYGWFERVERGVYAVKPAGKAALEQWPGLLEAFAARLAEADGDR